MKIIASIIFIIVMYFGFAAVLTWAVHSPANPINRAWKAYICSQEAYASALECQW